MFRAEIPDFIGEKFELLEKSQDFNGYNPKDSVVFKIGEQEIPVVRIKGNLGRRNCAVFCDPLTREYYKVGGTPEMKLKLEHEFLGISASLSVNGLFDLQTQLQILSAQVGLFCLPAVRSPNLGFSVESLLKFRDDLRVSQYLFSVYELAALQAKEIFNEYGIFITDPNPGNILLRKTNNYINISFVDFTASAFHKESSVKNELMLRDKFRQSAEKVLPRTFFI